LRDRNPEVALQKCLVRGAMSNLATDFARPGISSLLRRLAAALVLTLGAASALPTVSLADENGVSFWLPGLFGSLAAVPQQPPQVGYIVPLGSIQAYVNVKAYWEFDGRDRPSGFNTWLTLSLSPSAPLNPRSAMITK